jgi:hypothetical protein
MAPTASTGLAPFFHIAATAAPLFSRKYVVPNVTSSDPLPLSLLVIAKLHQNNRKSKFIALRGLGHVQLQRRTHTLACWWSEARFYRYFKIFLDYSISCILLLSLNLK